MCRLCGRECVTVGEDEAPSERDCADEPVDEVDDERLSAVEPARVIASGEDETSVVSSFSLCAVR